MTPWIGVALGGAAGSLLRHAVGLAMTAWLGAAFPWGTLLINVAGSLLIGWLASATLPGGPAPLPDDLRLLLMVGFCGGFTTFSSFSLQTLVLLQQEAYAAAAANILASVALCLIAVAIGFRLGARLWGAA